MYPSQEQGMPHGEGVTGAPAGTVVPQELLEEMLWFFRVEDGKWRGTGEWGNIRTISPNSSQDSLLGLPLKRPNASGKPRPPPATQYPRLRERTLNSVFFPPRKQKKLPREKPTPEVLTEAGTKDDNNLNILRETLLSEKLNLAEVDIELKERSMPAVFLPDPRESES
ncbi:organic solute transporter subunit beta [Myotis lucifugus]|uniref:organic solute transporter subunit beta n=1 Tax=Myotis lucifugus TaxID=59463 RepID=UPI000CCC43A5|nr:organic solute transporter subunit beta [Myotis lucifugus]